MLRRDWNALRPGDRVLVHHSVDGTVRLLPGVVTIGTAPESADTVAVRVDAGGAHQLIHPRRLRVHHDPIESDTHCWSCASSAPAAPAAKPRGGTPRTGDPS